ncbi:uncharacterized protein LOC123447043 [Hordeum vulgare subsp. vulgare]|uniref:Uncharacterized protein n=1 Tax=Hordeum vulgare subsp. vulgare TaxID=112509 RepID=A0A8I7B6N9_HORVV|nr:uncharacterized protein LOC123447043 [Hordeum vulgare subsp. vulgare]
MAAVARSPSPSPAAARPCPAMRRSADSNPFNPADCPSQRSSGPKGGACGCHHASSSPSPHRRSLSSSSFGEKENEPRDHAVPVRTPKAAARSKNFMAPTISAASKAASPRNSGKVLGERNHEPAPHLAPFSPANLAHKPKGRLRLSFDASLAGDDDAAGVENFVRGGGSHHHAAAADSVGADRRLRRSFEAPPAAHGPLAGDDDDDAGMEDPVRLGVGVNHQLAAADPVDAEPSRAALYDPKTNYTSPRPRFLHYKPNPRVDIYRHGRAGVRRLEDGFAAASESSEETDATATTEDDPLAGDDELTEEEQEQAQQIHLSEQQSALTAPSDDAVSAEACVLAPEPLLGSPPPPPLLLSSEAAPVTPEPARVSAPDPMAIPPRARAALTPEPELGVRAPEKKEKGSALRFLLPLAFMLFMSAASVCVLLQPDSPIMSNTALSRASSFLSVQESHPVELAAWLKQWSSSSLDSITSYWEALSSTSTQEQDYFGPHFAANWSAAAADGDHGAADFYYNFADAWPVPSEEPICSANAFTAEPEGDVVVEERSDASDYYDMVVDEFDVQMSEEAPGSSYGGAIVLGEQLNIQDAVSELIAESDGVAVVEEESDASGYSNAVDEFNAGLSEAAPGSSNGEEMASSSQDLDTPSQPTGQREQDVESEEPEENHGSGKEGQEPRLGLKSDSSTLPVYMGRISKPAAAAGVAIVVAILSAGVAAISMRKTQAGVATNANVPAEQEQAEEAETRSCSASSEGHRLVKGSVAEETERFGDSGFSQYSSSLSSGQGRGKKTKEEENVGQGRRKKTTKEEENVGLEPASKSESMSYPTSSYGSFLAFEKIAAKKKNKDDDEVMTPVRRSSRLRSVKSPDAGSS